MAEEPALTPDGYLGHPAFELGFNGSPDSYTYNENFSYTNYANKGMGTGTSSFNFNRIFLNVYYPITPTFTLLCGGSYLALATGSNSFQQTANNFTGTYNSATTYNYSQNFSWFFSAKIYTK